MPFRETVPTGNRLLTVDKQGRVAIHDGPDRVNVFRKLRHYNLIHYSAHQKEYLCVKYLDGRLENKPGPCYVFLNPHEIYSVTLEKSISLDANEALVVYSPGKDGTVKRKIMCGPNLFFPDAKEWLHDFVWHGTDKKDKTRKTPGSLTFTKLRVIPDQFYMNVTDVRTKDDAVLTVKLMIFFELKNIENMLNSTVDPVGDFINAVTADVVAFASIMAYEDFMENTSMLNVLDHYKQLLERSEHVGYQITKVVFRGYHAAGNLQGLHDKAVQKRTQMKVTLETEAKEQDLTDFKLRNEHQRESLEQTMRLEKMKHKHQLETEALLHELKLSEKQHEESVRLKRESALAELKTKEREQEEKLAYLRKLKSLGVDLTEYLTNENPRPTNLLRVVTTGRAGGGGGQAAIHIHG